MSTKKKILEEEMLKINHALLASINRNTYFEIIETSQTPILLAAEKGRHLNNWKEMN